MQKMNRQIAALMGGLFLFTPSLYAVSQSAVEAFNQGVQKFNASNFAEAVPFLNKAIDADGSFAEAYFARAICKRNLQDVQGAVSDLNQAIQNKPDYLDAYALRGSVWYEQQQWDSALQDFDHVLAHRPRDAQALLGRGVISLKQQHLQTAKHDFRLFLKLRPEDPLAPKLRRLLASLPDEPASEEPTPDRAPAASARPMSAASEKFAQDLFESSHALSDSYGRKVIRGEQAEAIGDIHVGQPPSKPKPSDDGIEIVDPGK